MARILIIDDEPDLANGLKVLLENEGHEAVTYNATEGAVEQVEEYDPDLLVLDVMFPEQPSGGFEIARKVRTVEKFQQLPIIMLTSVNKETSLGFSEKDIDSDWMPVQHFMEKPVDISAMIVKIKELLG